MPYTLRLRTVVETPIFERYARDIWSADELAAFVHWIAANPNAGEVIRGSGAAAKCAGLWRAKASEVAPG